MNYRDEGTSNVSLHSTKATAYSAVGTTDDINSPQRVHYFAIDKNLCSPFVRLDIHILWGGQGKNINKLETIKCLANGDIFVLMMFFIFYTLCCFTIVAPAWLSWGGTVPPRVSSFSKITNNMLFICKPTNQEPRLPNPSWSWLPHIKPMFLLRYVTPGQVPGRQGAPLHPRVLWRHSNSPILSSLSLLTRLTHSFS